MQAPAEDQAVLIEPPPQRLAALVDGNLQLRSQLDYDLQGRPLAKIAFLARRELLNAARRWTRQYRDVPEKAPEPAGPIFLAGHQPQMFHPGVWFKNFALGASAKKHGAAAVSLIIDADAVTDTSLTVPTGTLEEPRMVRVPLDRPEPKIPYEDRAIEDRALFASFGHRAIQEIAPLVSEPLLRRYWPLVLARAKETGNLGACLAQARHQLESTFLDPALSGAANNDTLEVPQSRLCAGEAFQWFVAHLLARLPTFRPIYNEALRDYRRVHHLRSRSHPAPELAEIDGWIEAPFWVWTVNSPRRRRLFARAAADKIQLSDREQWEMRLPLSAEADAGSAVERLSQLDRNGVRIRPRALMTTLWARLALGDLFIHGIGGAKYDWVTDRIIERFFRLRSPGILVVSATLHLPIEHAPTTARDVQALEDDLRGMTYHPERYLNAHVGSGRSMTSAVQELVAAKRRWIEMPQTRENARERCHAIRQINAALQPWLNGRPQFEERHAAAMRGLRAHQVLGWREYAFCLYPEPMLRKFFSAALASVL
ncbi:MAG: hypothetical protein LLG00_15105 [Planctomycetaceae bacterium]|nr:hypothetical protein [Planctomycetaceae bacterium]